ncbi:alpha/beta hydrolase [Lysinibacter sp. HNR]|uniref:alpha/beta hydrolase n=1 Tax=Lysinibacter sp. HNR TaxID=3031408 RepID=UPI0024355EA2|nr:alpha/beta hydrolase [Lysinibacter sp. HNR]WGD36331.1 alpha/beta hydrolase [Lysinibacter sp. HNR]
MSLRMTLSRVLFYAFPPYLNERTIRRAVSRPRKEATPPESIRKIAHIEESRVKGQRVLTLTPQKSPSGDQIIFLHGGGFVVPINLFHWWLVSALLRRSRATVIVPLYGLAPEYTATDAYEFLETLYLTATERSDGHEIFMMGDSAGGSLALGWAQRCRNEGLRAPDAVILVAPWVDLTMSNPQIPANKRRDPVLRRGGLQLAARWWAGEKDPSDPLVSVLHGDMHDLPPVYIYQGTHDLLYPDAVRLAQKITEAQGTVELRVYRGAFHDFIGALWTSEARSALRRIIAVTSSHGKKTLVHSEA